MSNDKELLVMAAWGAFGDTWHGYSATVCAKAKWPEKKIVFACEKQWLPLFSRSECVDDVMDVKNVNPNASNVCYNAFDIDEKWKADEFLNGFWGPKGWNNIVNNKKFKYGFKFKNTEVEYVLERLKRAEGKKIILYNTRFESESLDGASINNLRNLSMGKHLAIMKEASRRRNDIMFVRYFGEKESFVESIDNDYIIDVGNKFNIVGQAILMLLSDFLISVQSGVHNFAQALEVPRIMLVPCRDDNQTGYSHPDPCANPAQNQRYLFSNKTSGDICSYVKPRKGARLLNSVWANFWYRKHRYFKYRLLEDIEVSDVVDELFRRLDNPNSIGNDMFFENIPMCYHCEMKNDFGICPLYHYPPLLRNGRIPGQVSGSFWDLDLSNKVNKDNLTWRKYEPI